jgi:uncharacterized membrane protein
MEAAIENIVFLVVVGNIAVNQLMECEAVAIVTAKATSMEEPKWTTVIAKNVCQVVSWVVETLANAPKQKEHKLNPHLTGFEVKEGETEKEVVQ